MKKIVSIVGDYFHSHDEILSFVQDAAKRVGQLVEDRKLKDLEEVLSEKPDLLIFGLESRINPLDDVVETWFTNEWDKKITDYVAEGGHFIAWHAALASYPEESRYINMLGGYFLHHPEQTLQVHYTGNSEVFGKQSFSFEEEQYFVEVEENVQPFLFSKSECGTSLAAWVHSYGDGQVLCFCPTHTKEGYKNEECKRLFSRCIEYMK